MSTESRDSEDVADDADKDQLESLLRSDLVTINDLRDIIDDRGLNTTGRRTDKLVNAILSDKWTTDDFDELKEDLAAKQEETGPKAYYIQSIESIDTFTEYPLHEEIQERLKQDEAKVGDNTIIQDGFELTNSSEDKIEGVHWSQNKTYLLGPFNQLRSRESLYNSEFIIDIENDLVFIAANLYAKAQGLSASLRDKSMVLEPVGHNHLVSDDANPLVDAFVDDLEESLKSAADNSQADIDDFGDADESESSPLEIKMVEVQIESGKLKEVRVGGTDDIFNVDMVQHLQDEEDGKIAKIKGELFYENEYFSFAVSYNQDAGRVMVKKQGGAKGDVQIVQDAYDLLYDTYKDYFIDI